MAKIIAHIDLNAFFVRAEELRNPYLENKPVIVGGDGRSGIVSTCSYAARKFGIHSGMPTFKAKELCPSVIIIPVDFNYYEVLSIEFIQLIKSYTPLVEQTSIDECFADFTDAIKNVANPFEYFKGIQMDLFKKTGLKCSIGISTTKFLAKMGSDLKKPMGISILKRADIKDKLFPLPVGSYFGIGKATAPKLIEHNIKTIKDLYTAIVSKDEFIMKFYGEYTKDITNALEGRTDNTVITGYYDNQQSISNRTTLPYDIDNIDEIKNYLFDCFDYVFSKFLELQMFTEEITISYRYTDFATQTCAQKLKFATDDKLLLKDELNKLVDRSYNKKPIRQIGVILSKFTEKSDSMTQMTLFNYKYYEEKDQTKTIIDSFNKDINDATCKLKRTSELLKKNK
ncbi:MAG: DNA polymerase IV [Bacilli bacterium]